MANPTPIAAKTPYLTRNPLSIPDVYASLFLKYDALVARPDFEDTGKGRLEGRVDIFLRPKHGSSFEPVGTITDIAAPTGEQFEVQALATLRNQDLVMALLDKYLSRKSARE